METLSYEIEINAPKTKIWDILWSPETYTEWTKFFSPGSQMKSDWKIGGKTYFTDPSGNGMVSTISTLEEPNEVTFNHLGMIQDGKEDTETKEVKEWSGAPERYFLIELDNGNTKLQVEVQVSSEWKPMMDKGFIEGLKIVKDLSEK